MNILGVIPARYASTRFPGKALHQIDGKSMIQRVYEQVIQCDSLSGVVVATDHRLIEEHVKGFGGRVVMTSPDHQSGTERCAEATEKFPAPGNLHNVDIVVNIQGDEPFIHPEQIAEVISCFEDPSAGIGTLARKIKNAEDFTNPNVVKVVFNDRHQVLYFSRAPIPAIRNKPVEFGLERGLCYEHVGIYGYRISILNQLIKLPVSSLESAESLEQLRWLQHGFPITVKETTFQSISIDTPDDLLKLTNKTG